MYATTTERSIDKSRIRKTEESQGDDSKSTIG